MEHSAEGFGEVMKELYEVLEYRVRKHVLEADDLALTGYNFSFSYFCSLCQEIEQLNKLQQIAPADLKVYIRH